MNEVFLEMDRCETCGRLKPGYSLKPEQLDAIVKMREVEGKSFRQIGRIIGISHQAVCDRYKNYVLYKKDKVEGDK